MDIPAAFIPLFPKLQPRYFEAYGMVKGVYRPGEEYPSGSVFAVPPGTLCFYYSTKYSTGPVVPVVRGVTGGFWLQEWGELSTSGVTYRLWSPGTWNTNFWHLYRPAGITNTPVLTGDADPAEQLAYAKALQDKWLREVFSD